MSETTTNTSMGSILKDLYNWRRTISSEEEKNKLIHLVESKDDDQLIKALQLGEERHIRNIYFFSIHEISGDPDIVMVKYTLIQTRDKNPTLIVNVKKDIKQKERKGFVRSFYNCKYGVLYKASDMITEKVKPEVTYQEEQSPREKEIQNEKKDKKFQGKAGKKAGKKLEKFLDKKVSGKGNDENPNPSTLKGTVQIIVDRHKKRRHQTGSAPEHKSIFEIFKNQAEKAKRKAKNNLKKLDDDFSFKTIRNRANKAKGKIKKQAEEAKEFVTSGKIFKKGGRFSAARKFLKIGNKIVNVVSTGQDIYDDATSGDNFKRARTGVSVVLGVTAGILARNPKTGKTIYDATRKAFDVGKAIHDGSQPKKSLARLFTPYNILKGVLTAGAFVAGTVAGGPLAGIALATATMDGMDLVRDGVKYLARKYQQHTTHKNPYRHDYKKPMVHQPDALRVNRTIIDKNRFHTKASDDLFIKKLEKVARQKSAQKRKNTVKVNHAVINKNLFHEKGFDDFYIKELHKGAQQHTQEKQQSTRKHSRTHADKKVTQNSQAPVNITNQITMTGNTDIKTICETVLKGINDKLRDSVVAYG